MGPPSLDDAIAFRSATVRINEVRINSCAIYRTPTAACWPPSIRDATHWLDSLPRRWDDGRHRCQAADSLPAHRGVDWRSQTRTGRTPGWRCYHHGANHPARGAGRTRPPGRDVHADRERV